MIEVDAVFDELAHSTAHLFGSRDHNAKIEAFVRDMRRGGVAEATHRRNLRTRRQIARTGETSFIDETLGDNVEPRFGGCRATPGGEARIEHELRHLHGDQHMLFEFHHLDGIDAGGVVPGQMQMRIDQSGHEGRPHAVDDGVAMASARRCEPRRAAGNLFDAVALNDHLAGVGIFTAGVENAHIREVDRPGAVQAVCLVGHDASSFAAPQSAARVFQIGIPHMNPKGVCRTRSFFRSASNGRSG